MFDIKLYESWIEGDPRKSYQHLLDVIERQITRIREDKHVAAREKYARDFAGGGKSTTPALHHQHLLLRTQIRRPRQRPRRKLPKLRSRPPLCYHLHNRNNMPKVKGRGRIVESRKRQVQVHLTRRRSHAISTLSRSLARKGKIVSTVMTRRRSALARLVDREKEVERRQEANLQQTEQRR